jgi:hypothetical protein
MISKKESLLISIIEEKLENIMLAELVTYARLFIKTKINGSTVLLKRLIVARLVKKFLE